MPLVDDTVELSPQVQARFKAPENAPAMGFTDRLNAQVSGAFARENVIGSGVAMGEMPDRDLVRTDPLQAAIFDANEFLTDEEKAYSERFTRANSVNDLDAIRKQIVKETIARDAMASGPLPEWLIGTVASVLDPTTLIPIAGPLVKANRAATAMSGMVRVGVSSAAGVGVQEALLQHTQVSRTTEESVASILGGFVVGGVLGTAVGAMVGRQAARVPELYKSVDADLTQVIRASGLGDLPIPRAGLLDTTAVGRFLDNAGTSPRFAPARSVAPLPEREILNFIGDAKPHVLDNVTKAMADVEALQDRIARLEADPTLFSRAPDIRDRPTLDLLAALEKQGTPDALAKAQQIREGAQAAVTLDRLLNQLDEATLAWEKAEATLASEVKRVKKQLDEVGQGIGPKEVAQANADLAKLYASMKQALDEGKDPLKLHPVPNPMDWLKGIAQYPGREKIAPKPPSAGDTALAKEVEEAKLPDSVSAMAVPQGGHGRAWMDQMDRLRSTFKIAEISAKLKKVGLAAPAVELAMSRFETARKAIQLLAHTGLVTNGHWGGLRGPDDLATEIKALGTPAMIDMERILSAAWTDHGVAVKAGTVEKMGKLEFFEAVGAAMTRGDKDPNPVVQKAAQLLRKIDKKFADLATEHGVGVFKEAEAAMAKMQRTAPSHLQRVWHAERIRANPVGFKALAKDWWMRTHKGDASKVADDADDAAEAIYNKILKMPDGRLPSEIKVPEGRGSSQERTFLIPDDWKTLDGRYGTSDFVDRNVANVMARYIRTMASDVAYQKILGGDKGMEVMRKSMKFEADEMARALDGEKAEEIIKATKNAKNADDLEKALAKIEGKTGAQTRSVMNDLTREMRVIDDLANRLRGVDPHPVDPSFLGLKAVGKMARDYNVVRVMGSSLTSQLPDLGATVMSEGLLRVFGSALGDFLDGFKLMKLGVKDAQRIGTADDMLLGGRFGQMADMAEQYTRQSKAEILSGNVAHKSLMLFGVSPWTVMQKGRLSYLGADSLLRGVEKLAEGKPIRDAERARLANNGIDEEMAKLILAERENWDVHRGFYLPQTEKWKNLQAANAFDRALLRRIDTAIISPTVADAPLWTKTEVGKALNQFQNFGWAAHQRVLLAGLQYRDMDAFNSVMAMVALGMMATAMRDITAKGEVDPKRTPMGWVREGVDRSGVLSRFMEYGNIVDKASGGFVSRNITGGTTTRFQSTGLLERLAGPTGGLLIDMNRAAAGVLNKDFTGADLHTLRRLAPLQNYVLLNGGLNKIEENLVRDYGLAPRQIPR